jgi:hypothetical protein
MSAQEEYRVFARREHREALTQVGTLRLPPGQSVRDAARTQYGDDWLELVAIPERGIRWAIRED